MMKSILQEASSLTKAIEKAWLAAGQPKEFTVKIHQLNQKAFLWFTKEKAIISFLYESKASHPRSTKEPITLKTKQKTESTHIIKKEKNTAKATDKKVIIKREWDKELTEKILTWLKEILFISNTTTPFSVTTKQKALTITFQNKILDTFEDEKALFASLAYLLLQSLKKAHKRKFKDFRIILTSPHHNTSPKTP